MSEAVLFGSYELLDRIAEGGMAEVWRARSRGVAGFEKTVVIKRVLPSLMANPSFAELLVREAKIAALLSHPNIIQIFDLGEERGAYFIAMEHVAGKDLGQVMALGDGAAARGGLSLALKLWIVAEVAKALDYAHRRRGPDGRPLNIVHRDVSPQNVLLGFEGAVKVADFGIARADQQELGKGDDPKVLRGKYAYMSPEQARGEPLDRRSDLFSLGIVLYEVLTSRRLFRGRSSGETLELVRSASIPKLPESLERVDALEPIVRRALARDPDQRYPSAGDFGADLGSMLFELGAHVDEADLAEAMARMFPRDEEQNPNKLSVDLMLRAYDDATALSVPGRPAARTPHSDESGEGTRAFPSSRRLRSEARRVVLLAVTEREGDGPTFESVMESLGGFPLPPRDGVREAVFGHGGRSERADEHAARAALDLMRRLSLEGVRRADPLPVASIACGDAHIVAGEVVDPSPELSKRAKNVLAGRWPGEIRVEDELVPGLSRTFVFTEGHPPVLEGFRSRNEREALELRRRGPMSGRRDEMRLLSSALAEVSSGQHRAILVVGEPGSGKSRLVAELAALAASQDVVVVRGAGDEAAAEQSYGALADLFEDICGLESGDPPEQRFAKVERLRVLGLVPREVRHVGELLGIEYPLPAERRYGRPRSIELITAARRALRRLSEDGPVLLVLEDLQWMDDPTRQVLPILLRGLARSRVLTVMTARPGAAIPRLDAWVLPLSPLPADASGRVLAFGIGARAVEDELAQRVVEETYGNPGWIEAMAESLLEHDLVRIEDGVASLPAFVEVPLREEARMLVASRIAQLRPEMRDLVRAAALFDDGVELRTLAEVHGVPIDVAEHWIRRLVLMGLLVGAGPERSVFPAELVFPGSGTWGGGHVEHPMPSRVCVPGALLRRAIAGALPVAELRRMHGRIVAVLERGKLDEPARLAELAHHAARSVDRRRAPEYLIQAAEAFQSAGNLRDTALRLAEAAALAEETPECGHDPVELALRASDAALEASDPELAEHVLAPHTGAAARQPAEQVRFAVARARALGRRDRWSDAAFALAQVSDAIDSLSDAPLRARALLEHGRAEIEVGRPEEAVALLDRAQAIAGDSDVMVRGRALCWFGVALARKNQVEQADQAVAAALAVTARLGTGELRHLSLAAMAEAQAARGALGAAAARWVEAAEVAQKLGAFEEAARLDALAAVTLVEAGDESRAVPIAERAVREGRSHRASSAELLGLAAQGALAVQANPDPVWLPRIGAAVDRLEQMGRFGEASHAVQMLARAYRALGDSAEEAAALARAVELSDAGGHRAMAERLRRKIARASPP